MKQSEKPVIIFGVVLLALTAFFTLSIFIRLVNFGLSTSALYNGLLVTGHMLFSVYGFSSILIPVFLFTASIMLFTPGWNEKRGFFLAMSIIPFFTIVAAERLVVDTAASGVLMPESFIKISAIILIAVLLTAIEYLAGTIAFESVMSILRRSDDYEENEPLFDITEAERLNGDSEPVITEPPRPSSAFDEIQPAPTPYTSSLLPKSAPADNALFERIGNFTSAPIRHLETVAEESVSIDAIESLETPIDEIESPDITDTQEQPLEPIENTPAAADAETNYEFSQDIALDNAAEAIDASAIPAGEPTQEIINVEFRLPELDILGEPREIDNEAEIPIDDDNDEEMEDDFSSADLYSDDEADFLDDPFAADDEEQDEDQDDDDTLSADEPDEINGADDLDDDDVTHGYVSPFACEPADTNKPAADPLFHSVPKRKKNAPYYVPAEGLLAQYPDGEYWIIDAATQQAAVQLKETLSEFKIQAEVTGIRKGPVITMFEILPAPGVKLSKIVALQDNIALRLAASSVRIVAPIPGKHAVGIEVPNAERAIVSFRELIDNDAPGFKKMAIPVVLGKDITGEAQLLDLASTPHLLIAGSTGSGKSVCVNSMILSILYKRSPEDVKMILIDPKIVELKLYNDIPHLLTPVITEPKKAFQALQYCLCEMERRYALLDGMGVRDIKSYNRRIIERNIATEKLPYIVVVIDEFADLMATTGKELEATVARLAAMSRAVGVHLVLATQRPSIDVITGLIKANIPTRIAFMVASKMDSRIIIDQVGAEKLLGRGDMLYSSAVDPFPVRIQGTYVSEEEVENVVDYVKQFGEPEYIDEEIFVEDEETEIEPDLFNEGSDPLYDKALEIVIQAGKASASYIQRRLKIGYNRAARLVEDMEARGIVGPANGSKPREIIHIP